MGKNSVLKTLGKRIGNVVLHRLLVNHTNIPESKSHLQNEENEYRNEAIKDSREYNWNEEDKRLIKNMAIEFIKNKKEKRYNDVDFSLDEAKKLIDEEMINLDINTN